MNFIRSPDNAFSEDGTTPLVISPSEAGIIHRFAQAIDQAKLMLLIDVNNMLSQAPFAEEPRADDILNGPTHLRVPDRPLAIDRGRSPPWNGFHAEADYRAMAASDDMFNSIIDQNMLLNVPDNTRSRGTGGTRGSFSTVGTPYTAFSDGRSDVSQERIEARRGGRQPGSRLPEADVQNVRQVRGTGACIRCKMLRMKVSLRMIWIVDSISVSDSSSVQM